MLFKEAHVHKRIAIAALAATFAAGSLLGALAKPALADADDHARQAHHHHAYQNNGKHTGWNKGEHKGWVNGRYVGNTGNGTWVNGKYYPNGYTGNPIGNWNNKHRVGDGDHDRDDRKYKHHHHKDTDGRR